MSPVLLSYGLAFAVLGLVVSHADDNGNLQAREEFRKPENRALKFQTASQAFPTRVVRASNDVWKLERDLTLFRPAYVFKGATNGIEQFNLHTFGSALLVLKNSKIVHESYLAGS